MIQKPMIPIQKKIQNTLLALPKPITFPRGERGERGGGGGKSQHYPNILHTQISQKDNPETILSLIQHPRSSHLVRQTNNKNETPLHIACRTPNTSPRVIAALLSRYPNAMNLTSSDGFTPLHVACLYGADMEVVRMLMDRFSASLQREDFSGGWSPLHIACRGGEEAISGNASLVLVKELVDWHPQSLLNKTAFGRYTPLHVACSSFSSSLSRSSLVHTYELMEMLIKNQPLACEEKNRSGSLPVHCLVTSAWDQRDFFEGEKENRVQLMRILQLFLETCPKSVMEKNDDGCTPLRAFNRCRKGQKCIWGEEVCELLKDMEIIVTQFDNSNNNNNNSITPAVDNKELILKILKKFTSTSWWGGISLLLDARPSLVHSLDLDDFLIPELIFNLSRRKSGMNSMFGILREMPPLLQNY